MIIPILRLLLLVLFYSCSAPAWAESNKQKSILLLSPDLLSSPYLYDFYSAFKLKLNEGRSESVVIYEESLDLSRFPTGTYPPNLDKWLNLKYKNTKIDAIVVIGHSALNYLLEYRQVLWPDVPILYTLASDVEIKKISLPENVAGISLKAGFADVVGLAKKLLPETRHIAILGNSPEFDVYRNDLPEEIARFSAEIDIIDLRGKTLSELRIAVASLPKNTVVYFTMLTRDGASKKLDGKYALQEIVRMANAPLLVDNPTHIGLGPIGAISFDASIQGRETADLLSKLLGGEKTSSLPIKKLTFTPLLDWRELKRWGVEKSNYPVGSELRFFTPGVWELYRWQIAATFTVMALLLALLGALLIERKRRSAAVDESRQRLTQIAFMNRKITATVYSEAIAHELIQPLAAILSNAEAAQLFLSQSPPQLEMVQDILANIKRDNLRAGDLIKSMRGLLTKSDSKNESKDTLVNINDMVRKVLNFLSGEAKMRHVQLNDELTAVTLFVSADPVQLQQIMVNLILNGLDAIDERNGFRRNILVVTELYDANNVQVSVIDSGAGFNENIERVFDSFFTTKAKGMGLGLAITEAIVQAHGGRIWAENAADGGVVRFTLPLAEAVRDE
ncbi:sensor histidine kinase [Undibacterium parvum]|uniref:histidine kinase n=1 Tax=Undibacterium parvum TaxID=401471 RepID=A0A3S5HM27_9BURK|nr:sensor histidine kinase [Undibacterium parvum]AZP13765.1 hypothetical protein EJN92_18290 [Undibacterium parvum]